MSTPSADTSTIPSRVCHARIHRMIFHATAWLCFALALATYLLTLAPSASYWDCPEYVISAFRLEPGHPPGNPFYMLAGHVFTLFASSTATVAWWVNLLSAILSAAAVWLTYHCAGIFISRLLFKSRVSSALRFAMTLCGSFCAAMTLAWSDSFWFSAVEAEVYAFSAFGTALSLWLMLRWLVCRDPGRSDRLLILSAYVIGLMLGVHQLNLLCIPALALIFAIKRGGRASVRTLLLALGAGILVTGAIYLGLLQGLPALAAASELLCVNTLHMPYHSGVVALMVLLLTALFCVIAWATRKGRRACACAAWMTTMLLVGFSSFAVIYIRGVANPPMNQGGIDSIFALQSYMRRDQYGTNPLLYGRTPYSKVMRVEEATLDSAGHIASARYSRPATKPGHPVVKRRADGSGYETVRHLSVMCYPPELDMWLPRIYSSNPDDIEAYGKWAGMDSTTMQTVEYSQAVDSLGNPVGQWDAVSGRRVKGKALKPTYLQNLQYLAGYQTGYMYLRYLMWNFSGRQNDVHSQGQADAGNFITGVAPLDDAMLGPQSRMPQELSRDNAGRNVYFMLPLLLGIAGIVWQLSRGQRGRRQFAVLLTLFFMTGLAIVLYLNQTPGEPRERDYSFVGSFFTYSLWVGLGCAATGWWLRRRALLALIVTALFAVAIPGLLVAQNFRDHDRSGITVPRDFAAAMLRAVPRDAILIVNGDNYTFPSWYISEVEGVRPDVRIVNTAYLSTDWYPDQLLIPTRGAASVPMTARSGTFTDGRFGIVYLNLSSPDTIDALPALHGLYEATARGGRPELPATRLRYHTPGGKSGVLDLTALMPGKRYLQQREVATLDIIFTALEQGRPVAWMDNLGGDKLMGFNDASVLTGPVRVLSPFATAADSAQADRRAYRLFTSEMDFGGVGNPGKCGYRYIDPVTGRMITDMRVRMTRLSRRLLERGDTAEALTLLRTMERELPREAWGYRRVSTGAGSFNSGVEAARIYADVATARGDTALLGHALDLLEHEARRSAEYVDFHEGAGARIRSVTGTSFRQEVLYAPQVQSLLDSLQP